MSWKYPCLFTPPIAHLFILARLLCRQGRMAAELTEVEEKLLPHMTNELYQKYCSIIARHFPILSVVGHRLVDNGLLTIPEYKELCNLPETSAGTALLYSLERKGDDSMATFYKVLVGAREERDVAVILQHLEEEAERRKDSGVSDMDLDVDSLPGGAQSANYAARCNVKVDLAIKRISEVGQETKEEIRHLKEEILKMKEEVQKLAEMQTREWQLMHYLQTALPELDVASIVSTEYWTCPSTRKGSGIGHEYESAPESRRESSELSFLPPVAASMRRQSLPAPLHRSTASKHHIIDTRQSEAILKDKLESVPEESANLSTQHTADITQASLASVEEQQVDNQAPSQGMRQRRPTTVNPIKALFRRLSRSGRE